MLFTMTITWGRLRRRNDRNGQAAGTEADEHGSRASKKRWERQKVQQEVKRELSGGDPRSPGACNIPGGGF
jgi:hypothetical protein